MNDRASPAMTPELVESHGLSREEYARILEILGRKPNLVELGIFSVMWSEHCSYKSSKAWLKRLPTEGPRVLFGPGENAGVVDIGDGQALVFKMESHNHPSFIEPYQGAATGVGGILRDVFTMGARPIANLNALRFGSPDHPKTRHLVAGVVAGIGDYGNCIGVPTVAGECTFHPSYNGNILVNAMTVGLLERARIFRSVAEGAGNLVVYVGSKTGRDGIHGATMASASFTDDSEAKRPTVQVGDPFTEKLLLEACLELMATDAIVAIQDMGAAGLTSSSFEMASKGGLGIEMILDRVPTREPDMTPYEIMLSESQERMLMVIRPEREQAARRIFEKWELDFAVIGRLTDTGHMVLRTGGETVGELPIAPLAANAPVYERARAERPKRAPLDPASVPLRLQPADALLKLIGCPDLCSRRWIWEQYDHMVMADTVARPGGDAAIVRVHGTNKGVALTCDCTPRYCRADPYLGGAQAVVETWRNLTAVGARPLAITDCLNFGNPERPDVMAEFVGAIEGMRAACLALDFPVVSGNVSFYNETNEESIQPAPEIGGVGLIADINRRVGIAFAAAGETIVLIGETKGHLGSSLYLHEIEGREDGAPPPLDLAAERRNGDFVRALIEGRRVSACHDLSDGGVFVGVAEMALAAAASGRILGARLIMPQPEGLPLHAWLFGEDQGRYLLTVAPDELTRVLEDARKAGVPARPLGETGGAALTLQGGDAISIARLAEAHEAWFPRYMA